MFQIRMIVQNSPVADPYQTVEIRHGSDKNSAAQFYILFYARSRVNNIGKFQTGVCISPLDCLAVFVVTNGAKVKKGWFRLFKISSVCTVILQMIWIILFLLLIHISLNRNI